MLNMNKAVFLDRDGVINRKLEDDYVKKWDEFCFLPGVFEAIKTIKEKGYLVIVVTNQRGIARGFMTEKDLEEIHQKMQKELKKHGAQVDDIFYCPHDIKDNCTCGKPQPGMLFSAQKKWNIDLAQSYIIGDSDSDFEASRGAFTMKQILLSQEANLIFRFQLSN